MNTLAVFLLIVAFLLTRTLNLRVAITVLIIQSILIATVCIFLGMETNELHIYIAAILTVIIKVGLVPAALLNTVNKIRYNHEVDLTVNRNLSSIVAGLCIVLSYDVVQTTLPEIVNRDVAAAAFSLVFIGLFIIIIRKQAIMQIVGLITIENGLYLLGLSITNGLPLIIEFGIFLDVFMAVVILSVLTKQIKYSFYSTDTTMLKNLKG